MSQEPCKKCGEYHNNCYGFSELTDEDMLDCLKKVDPEAVRLPKGFKLFAEELLRKAQEK